MLPEGDARGRSPLETTKRTNQPQPAQTKQPAVTNPQQNRGGRYKRKETRCNNRAARTTNRGEQLVKRGREGWQSGRTPLTTHPFPLFPPPRPLCRASTYSAQLVSLPRFIAFSFCLLVSTRAFGFCLLGGPPVFAARPCPPPAVSPAFIVA